MSLMLARRSRVVFRHLNLTEPSFTSGRVSLPLRHAASSSPVGFRRSGIFGTLLPSIEKNSYATAVAKPKAHTGKTKASSKPAKSSADKPAQKTANNKTRSSKANSPGRPKKVLSKEEKEALKEKNKALKEKKRIDELKVAALKAPRRLPSTVHTVLVAELSQEKGTSGVDAAKKASEVQENLTSQQRQDYEQTAESNKSLNQAAYEAWVQSHTPLQIKEANRARARLSKLSSKDGKGTSRAWPKIVDPRQVKAPSNAMIFYNAEQRATGEFSNMSVTESAKQLYKQFSGLPEYQKEKYQEMAARDKARYYQQYKEVYGVEAPSAPS